MKHSNRKGQLVFEFMIAAVFFFYIVFYVLNYLNTAAGVFSDDFYTNSLEFKALESSEILLHSEGTWNGNVPETLGLAVEWPVLNRTKIIKFDAYCGDDPVNDPANYQKILGKLDINYSRGHGMLLYINTSSENLLECGLLPDGFLSANIQRFALSDQDELLTINMWVW